MITYAQSKAGYANLWAKAAVRGQYVASARQWAQKIINAKTTYQAVEAVTAVPWFFIGLLHMRESSLNFSTYLGNGQPLNRVTTIVPKGRGPFPSWQAGAEDALTYDGLANNGAPWHEIPYLLWAAEKYNGQGYFQLGINSPYVWSWTTNYTSGKYVADGKYSPTAVDQQPGIAAILGELLVMDKDVAAYLTPAPSPTGAPPVVSQANPIPTPAPAPTAPAATAAVSDPIPQIIATLKGAQGIINTAAMFIPAPYSTAVSIGVPLIEDLLQTIEDLKSGQNIVQTIANGLQTLAGHLQNISATLPKP